MEQKTKPTANRILQAAAGLLCLALLSAWALSGLLARFVSSSEDGDAASVASFHITDDTSSVTQSITLKPGSNIGSVDDDSQFQVVVTNDSEVAVNYTFSMKLTGNLPLTVATTETGLTKENDQLIWHATAPASASSSTYTFYPVWPENDSDYRYSKGVESIQVTVTAEQED
jgi:hypothetical protein